MASGRWGGWLCALWALSCGDDGGTSGIDAGQPFDASGSGATEHPSDDTIATNHDDEETNTDVDVSDSLTSSDSDGATALDDDGQDTAPVASEGATTDSDDADAGNGESEADAASPHTDTGSETSDTTEIQADAGANTSSESSDAAADEPPLDASSPSNSNTLDDELDASVELDAAVTDSASPSGTGTANPLPTGTPPGTTTTPPGPTTPPGSDPELDASVVDAGPDDLSIYCAAVRDQFNLGGGDYSVLGAATSFGQTFTVGVNGRLAAIELKLGPQMVDPERVKLEIFEADLSRGNVKLAVSDAVFGPLDASVNAGPGYFDVTDLRIDVTVGQVLYFEVTLAQQANDTCESGYCQLSETYCDFDFECESSLTVGTEQHAPENQENLYLGGMMFIDGVEYDHNDYFHDRDLQFKTVVLPIVDAPECVEPVDASVGDAQVPDAAP